MPRVEREMHKDGDFLVDYEEKVFEDVQAEPGEKALVTFHTMAFEGSISIVNTLTATHAPHHAGVSDDSKLNGPLRKADADDLSEGIFKQLGPLSIVQLSPVNGVGLVACKKNCRRMPDLQKFAQILVTECFQSRVEGRP